MNKLPIVFTATLYALISVVLFITGFFMIFNFIIGEESLVYLGYGILMCLNGLMVVAMWKWITSQILEVRSDLDHIMDMEKFQHLQKAIKEKL